MYWFTGTRRMPNNNMRSHSFVSNLGFGMTQPVSKSRIRAAPKARARVKVSAAGNPTAAALAKT
jgi:hypothetical protein